MKNPIILHSKFPSSSPSPFYNFHNLNLTISPNFPSHFTNFHLLFSSRHSFSPLQVTRVNTSSLGVPDNHYDDHSDDDDLVIEASVTRYLPPALTLNHGLEALKVALSEFKLNPPSSSGGLIRFQVAVPPGVKAFEWFSCQPDSSGVFPQFYMSKQSQDPTRGVFGVGIAVHSALNFDEWNSFRRYLLVDAPNMTVYGFSGFNYNIESSSLKHESGSCCFIIPQIELNECEGFCVLAGTLVWNNSRLRKFEQALHSYETSLLQAINHVPVTLDTCFTNFAKFIQTFNIVEDENLEMFYMEASGLGSYNDPSSVVEMKSVSSSSRFCIRLSGETAVSKCMGDDTSITKSILQDCANINSIWASLIVEECSRLGLTYFCIAPGSRSSPLAVAASTHPRITCVVCYDERSLAFHAIGYARGSHIPAVVITTSGTAVSNLFPAVVEASQDFVPLVLLTADRPAELLAAGANQAIDQVNHFGSYVRFFFNLPPPTDQIPARMVLTTIDTAINRAISTPCGPVHINCSFREPLDNSPKNYMRSCLDRLDPWISSTQPFTNYIKLQPSYTQNSSYILTTEVENMINNCKRGLLVVGSIHKEEEMWAALLLARHLSWPIVVDILSGLRLRKLMSSYREYEDQFVFVDHFDHVLLCDSARQWAKVDVVIQLGRKITSARVSRYLEQCFPCSFIMVDNHPYRHDPSHIVTHRIQCTISQFSGCLLKGTFPRVRSKWNRFLQIMDKTVAWELSFQISSEYSLTEPHVSQILSEVIDSESSLFIGNSMVIRDADMYSRAIVNCKDKSSQFGLSCQWINIVGNRGASGIDGLLSTAVGFSVGCQKRVYCLIGDVSFLHDTNGLAILSSRMKRKPITILLINNHGGGIFSFLPIAEKTDAQILEKYFYYNHAISFSKLCAAHGVMHLLAETKLELHQAILTSQQVNEDCVIEVSGSININATFHSLLRKHAAQTVSHVFTTLSQICPQHAFEEDFFFKISKLDYSLYEVNLAAPPTSTSIVSDLSKFVRQGFILTLTLDDGSTGFGEIAPLEIHEENLQDVEEQLRFLLHILKGATISYHLPLLRESFSVWMWKVIGVPPDSMYPSVRCGLEMAILNAIATRQKCTLLDVLWPQATKVNMISNGGASIDICALVDSEGGPKEVANTVFLLVEQGFCAVKVKVARREDPKEDAEIIKEIRKKIGPKVELRVDANRKWTYEKALEFGSLVKECGLEYIEEPVQCEDDIVRFCQETGLPIALDETIDNIQDSIPDSLSRFTHPGVVALVIKPSVVGGFENASAIAWWAHNKGKKAVVSATYETSLGLSSYVQFARFLEMRNAELSRTLDKNPPKSVAHGFGTYKWLVEDSTLNPLSVCQQPNSTHMGASIENANFVLKSFQVNYDVILRRSFEEQISKYQLVIEVEDLSYVVNVQEIGDSKSNNTLLFLHGFLGTSEDWTSIMKSLPPNARCISVDLPGHGKSRIQSRDSVGQTSGQSLSIEVVAAILGELISKLRSRKIIVIGYSMGARIALYMALRLGAKIDGAIMISGSPGLKDETERRIRAFKDDSRARSLISFGLTSFLDNWYHGDLWKSFRDHPSFNKIVTSRSEHDDIYGLAQILSDLSVGRQPSLWEDLKHSKIPLLFIVGEKDEKFKKITERISSEIGRTTKLETVEVPNSGHAVHLENPLAIIRLVRRFLTETS